jgi:hypothetical protein
MLNKTIDDEPMCVSVLRIFRKIRYYIFLTIICEYTISYKKISAHRLRDIALKASFYLRVQPTTGADVKPPTVDRGSYTVLAGRAYRTSQRR